MVSQVKVDALIGFEQHEDAVFAAEVLRKIVGDRSNVKLLERSGRVMKVIPDVEKFDNRQATRGNQEASALAGTLAQRLNKAFNTDTITPVKALDEVTRTWDVDYRAMLEQVKVIDAAGGVLFRETVSGLLADTALRGLKM